MGAFLTHYIAGGKASASRNFTAPIKRAVMNWAQSRDKIVPVDPVGVAARRLAAQAQGRRRIFSLLPWGVF